MVPIIDLVIFLTPALSLSHTQTHIGFLSHSTGATKKKSPFFFKVDEKKGRGGRGGDKEMGSMV